jgi:amphi-Trp domain-containing protein
MGDRKFTSKEELTLEEAVERLQKLVDEFKQRKVVLMSEGESYLVEPAGEVKLELEFEEKKGKEELEIELSWKLAGASEEEEEEGEEEEEKEENEAVESAKSPMMEPCSCESCSPGAAPCQGHGHPLKKMMPLVALGFAVATIVVAKKNGLPQWAVDLKDKVLRRTPVIEEVLVVEVPSPLPKWVVARKDKLPSWAVDRGEESLRRVAELKERRFRR